VTECLAQCCDKVCRYWVKEEKDPSYFSSHSISLLLCHQELRGMWYQLIIPLVRWILVGVVL